jgi:hypothetical protein
VIQKNPQIVYFTNDLPDEFTGIGSVGLSKGRAENGTYKNPTTVAGRECSLAK